MNDLLNKYARSNQGLFYVYIQSTATLPSPIHPLSIGRSLVKLYNNEIKEIKKLGFSKVSIKFKFKEAANQLITLQPLKEQNCICYIPNYRIYRQGVIKGVPVDISAEELRPGIATPVEITAIHRLNHKITIINEKIEKETKIVPSSSVVLSFLNQILPKYIMIFSVRYEITPFIPKTSICHSCFRF